MGDEIWIARYLLVRVVAEQWSVDVSFHPEPLRGYWNGHTTIPPSWCVKLAAFIL